jgi:hypothetical protein
MFSARRSSKAPKPNPLVLVIHPRSVKSDDIFKLFSLYHISMKVEAYKSQIFLTQCFHCQQLGHVWSNCKQPSYCLWGASEHIFDSGVLQLSAGGRRTSTSRQLLRLQARQRREMLKKKPHIPPTTAAASTPTKRDAEEEAADNTQTHVW